MTHGEVALLKVLIDLGALLLQLAALLDDESAQLLGVLDPLRRQIRVGLVRVLDERLARAREPDGTVLHGQPSGKQHVTHAIANVHQIEDDSRLEVALDVVHDETLADVVDLDERPARRVHRLVRLLVVLDPRQIVLDRAVFVSEVYPGVTYASGSHPL